MKIHNSHAQKIILTQLQKFFHCHFPKQLWLFCDFASAPEFLFCISSRRWQWNYRGQQHQRKWVRGYVRCMCCDLHGNLSPLWRIQTEQHSRTARGAVPFADPSDPTFHRELDGEGVEDGAPGGGGRYETDGGADEVEGGGRCDGQVLHGGLHRHHLRLSHLPPPQGAHHVNICVLKPSSSQERTLCKHLRLSHLPAPRGAHPVNICVSLTFLLPGVHTM